MEALADFKEVLHPDLMPAWRAINVRGGLVGWVLLRALAVGRTDGRTRGRRTCWTDGPTGGRTQNKGVRALQSVERETSLRCSLISLEGYSAWWMF